MGSGVGGDQGWRRWRWRVRVHRCRRHVKAPSRATAAVRLTTWNSSTPRANVPLISGQPCLAAADLGWQQRASARGAPREACTRRGRSGAAVGGALQYCPARSSALSPAPLLTQSSTTLSRPMTPMAVPSKKARCPSSGRLHTCVGGSGSGLTLPAAVKGLLAVAYGPAWEALP